MRTTEKAMDLVLNLNNLAPTGIWRKKILDSDAMRGLWEESENFEEFCNKVLEHNYFDFFRDSYGRKVFGEISKRDNRHWYRIREYFGDKCFKTWSDIGSLLVNNNTLIHNQYGDGETRVAIFSKGDSDYKGIAFFEDMMNLCGVMFNGKIDIYDYDIIGEGKVCKTIEGCYFVYVYDGLIAFVEM